jgi:site-specific DNA recombinase
MTDIATVYSNAVLYLRVSTKEQAHKGGEAEGYSIPAQRAACIKKAEALGAKVTAEYVDAGESAKTSARPQLQAMLARLAEGGIQYVIVHKVDRLARNRVDDVTINVAIKKAGARLVSVSENIDETPSGHLMHGIMSSIAEFYSQNLSTEVLKGMTQKVKNGGTPGLAPIGYLNIPIVVENRRKSTVQVDPQRGPLIQWAFQTYARGDVSLTTLADMLAAKGLVSLHRKGTAPRTLSRSHVHRLLKNRYYLGKVRWNGVEHEGAHPPLVTMATFQKVQDVLLGHRVAGDRQREHNNYLRGTLMCGLCGKRLCFTRVVKPSELVFDYFFCVGRQKHTCNLAMLKAILPERFLERQWQTIQLDPEYQDILRRIILEELHEIYKNNELMQKSAERKRSEIMKQQQKLLEAHYADAIPMDVLKREQSRLAQEHEAIERAIYDNNIIVANVERNLDRCLTYIRDMPGTYEKATPKQRRLMNQAMFQQVAIDSPQDLELHLREEFGVLFTTDIIRPANKEQKEEQDTLPSYIFEPDDWSDGLPARLVDGKWWEKIKQAIFACENRPVRDILEENGLSLNKSHLVRVRGL